MTHKKTMMNYNPSNLAVGKQTELTTLPKIMAKAEIHDTKSQTVKPVIQLEDLPSGPGSSMPKIK